MKTTMNSTLYCAIHNGIVQARGNRRDMFRVVKTNGGSRAGWSLGCGFGPVGTTTRKN